MDGRVPVFALGEAQGEAGFDDRLHRLVAVEVRAVVQGEVGINARHNVETLLQCLVQKAAVVGGRAEAQGVVEADCVGTKVLDDTQVVATGGAPLRLVAELHHVLARHLLLASVVSRARQGSIGNPTQGPKGQWRGTGRGTVRVGCNDDRNDRSHQHQGCHDAGNDTAAVAAPFLRLLRGGFTVGHGHGFKSEGPS